MKKITFFLFNLLAAFLLIGGLCLWVLHWLDDYTRHGEFIPVPSFCGMTLEEADKTVTSTRLRLQVIDSVYDKNARPGTVVEQYPESGSPVKGNRLIYITINAKNPEKVALPDLQNTAYRQTLQTLQSRGFRIGRIEYTASEFKNLVVQLKYKGEEVFPGTLLSKEAEIDIVLGSGNGSNMVNPPPLFGKNLKEAIGLIRKSYLNIGEIIPDGSITPANRLSAFICQQTPEPDEQVEAGTSVKLYITMEKEKLAAPDSTEIKEQVAD